MVQLENVVAYRSIKNLITANGMNKNSNGYEK